MKNSKFVPWHHQLRGISASDSGHFPLMDIVKRTRAFGFGRSGVIGDSDVTLTSSYSAKASIMINGSHSKEYVLPSRGPQTRRSSCSISL
ncbi:hypothetical protein Tco_0639367 [Tanacetum coccineum]